MGLPALASIIFAFMRLRLAILRVLLLALCFNTTVGMAAHAAEHLREVLAASFIQVPDARPTSLAAGPDVPQTAGPEAAQAEGDHESHGRLCEWCVAFSHPSVGLGAAQTVALPVQAAVPPQPLRDTGFVPEPRRWRFASRDPPERG